MDDSHFLFLFYYIIYHLKLREILLYIMGIRILLFSFITRTCSYFALVVILCFTYEVTPFYYAV